MRLNSVFFLAAMFLAGCVVPPVEMKTKFNSDEYVGYRQVGTGVISGQGFLRQKGGGVVTCAGGDVMILPATPFFREFIEKSFVSGQPAKLDYQLGLINRPIMKQSQCNAQGNFSFSRLPAGSWLVMTEVKWMAGNYWQGGALMREVVVSEGQSTEVVLSDNDRIAH